MKAADGMIGSDAVAGPGGAAIAPVLDESQAITVGSAEGEALLPESFLAREVRHAGAGKVLLPEAERALRHRECGGADFARARAAADHMGEREVGHDRAGRADFV